MDYAKVSDHFTSDDSLRDSSSDSSSETLPYSSSDTSSDSSSSHPPVSSLGMRSSLQLCSFVPRVPCLPAPITERPSHSLPANSSRKRSRSFTTSIPMSAPIPGALSSIRVDLLPHRKRIRSLDYFSNVEVDPEDSIEVSRSIETDLDLDGDMEASHELSTEQEINLVERDIQACFNFADIIHAKEGFERITHPVVSDDVPKPAQKERVAGRTYKTLDSLVQRVVTLGQQGTAQAERIGMLQRENLKLRGLICIERERVDRVCRRMSGIQRDLRQIRRFHFYDRMRLRRLESFMERRCGFHP
ncbi:hypothetical protein Tco_0640592 [Tanacetum coccineum]